jgi:hypothetical protein
MQRRAGEEIGPHGPKMAVAGRVRLIIPAKALICLRRAAVNQFRSELA